MSDETIGGVLWFIAIMGIMIIGNSVELPFGILCVLCIVAGFVIVAITNSWVNKGYISSSASIRKKAEDEKFKRQKEEDPVYRASKKVYHYAPTIYKYSSSDNKYLEKLYKDLAKSLLLDKSNAFEGIAIGEEYKSREYEDVPIIYGNEKNEIIECVRVQLDADIRPELIVQSLINYFQNSQEKFSKEKVTKICNALNRLERSHFNDVYSSILSGKSINQEDSYNYYTDEYNNSAPEEGLGFGIITNSPAQAMLYTAMDSHEKIKKENRKYTNYKYNVSISTGDSVINIVHKIENLYLEFGSRLIEKLEKNI